MAKVKWEDKFMVLDYESKPMPVYVIFYVDDDGYGVEVVEEEDTFADFMRLGYEDAVILYEAICKDFKKCVYIQDIGKSLKLIEARHKINIGVVESKIIEDGVAMTKKVTIPKDTYFCPTCGSLEIVGEQTLGAKMNNPGEDDDGLLRINFEPHYFYCPDCGDEWKSESDCYTAVEKEVEVIVKECELV